jgi:hypothetical protein
VACSSEMAYCSTSSSIILWWTTHVRSGCPMPTHTLINCKCCNPSVFPLRLTHPGTLATSKSTRIWGFHSSPTELWLGVNWCVEPLSSVTWKAPMPTKSRLKSLAGTEESWLSAGQSSLTLKRQPIRRND